MKELTICAEDSSQRLDKYLRRLLPQAAGGFLYKMLRKKNITLNDGKASGDERLKEGDVVRVWFSDETFAKLSARKEAPQEYEALKDFPVRLEVLFEDRDRIFLNKPAGILSQKAKTLDVSLNEHLRAYLIQHEGLSFESYRDFRPSVMNRLDFGTSGVVAAAKTRSGARLLSEWIRSHQLKKEYLCLVRGHFQSEGLKISYLFKDETCNQVTLFREPQEGAARIETVFSCVKAYERCSLVAAELITGKSHQIRAQLSGEGHPILLDAKYGREEDDRALRKTLSYSGQLLHAWHMRLPDGGEVFAGLPRAFGQAKAFLEKREDEWQHGRRGGFGAPR